MGNAHEVVSDLRKREVRPDPPPAAMRPGPRRAEPDGSITVNERWGQRPDEPAPEVDRSPRRVTD